MAEHDGMSDEELAAIKAHMDTPHFYVGSVPAEIEDELTQDARDIGALLAEVERLRVELAASDRLGEYVAGSASRTLDEKWTYWQAYWKAEVGALDAEVKRLRAVVDFERKNAEYHQAERFKLTQENAALREIAARALPATVTETGDMNRIAREWQDYDRDPAGS